MLDCSSISLSVSLHQPQSMCHYCLSVSLQYNARMSANLSACPPLCLCASLNSQASLAVWAAFCLRAEGWSAGVILWGHVNVCLSLGMHARRWQHEKNCGMKTPGNIFHKQVIMWNKLGAHYHWHFFFSNKKLSEIKMFLITELCFVFVCKFDL